MKKQRFLELVLIMFSVGLILSACGGNGTPNNTTVVPDDPLVFSGTFASKTVRLTISQTDFSRAVLTPKSGDFYQVRYDNELISSGQIVILGSIWTFTPSTNSPCSKVPFTANYVNGTLSQLSIPDTVLLNITLTSGNTVTPGPGGDDQLPPLTGKVSIDYKSPKVGYVLSAYYSGNGSGAETWEWFRGNVPIDNTNSPYYLVDPENEGATIKVRVSFNNQAGSVTSAETNAVPADLRPDLTGKVTIDFTTPYLGDIITATYTPGNGEGPPSWYWLRNDTLISDLGGQTYTVTVEDIGKSIRALVIFLDQKGSVKSAGSKTVPDSRDDLTGIVSIDNTSPIVGEILSATYTPGNGSGDATWQWLRDNDPIAGSDYFNYKVRPADEGHALKVSVSFKNQKGSVSSSATSIVYAKVDAPPNPLEALEVSFDRSRASDKGMEFSVKAISGAGEYSFYRVGVGQMGSSASPNEIWIDSVFEGTPVIDADSWTSIYVTAHRLHIDYSLPTIFPAMIKYETDPGNLNVRNKKIAVDWLNFLDVGLEYLKEAFPADYTTALGDLHVLIIAAKGNTAALNADADAVLTTLDKTKLYAAMKAVLNRYTAIFTWLSNPVNIAAGTGDSIKTFLDAHAYRLWFNQTMNPENDGLLSNLLIAKLKTAWPSLSTVK